MLDSLVQQFAGGGANTMEGPQLHDNVGQMLSAAPEGHVTGAIGEALGALGGGGFGQSVQQGTANASQEQRNGVADMLLGAISQGGGSPENALSQVGASGGSLGPTELGNLAEHAFNNHPDALASVLGGQLNSGGGGSGGILGLLGSPIVRQVGMSLAGRLL